MALELEQPVHFAIVNECGHGVVDTNEFAIELASRLQSSVVLVEHSGKSLNEVQARMASNEYLIVLSCAERKTGNVAEVDQEVRTATVFVRRMMQEIDHDKLNSQQSRALLMTICTGIGARLLGMDYCTLPLCALSSKVSTGVTSTTLCPPCQVILSRRLAVLISGKID
ncbi:MAG: hypothetical protein O3C57_00415 [Verrucomicrobia bacterium]|nr:hypothetical protein [Verrucomicrobiota bacterium]